MGTYHSLQLELDPRLSAELIGTLEAAGLSVNRLIKLSSNSSGFVSVCISSLASCFPWKSVADVLTAWIQAKHNCELQIIKPDGTSITAKGKTAIDALKQLEGADTLLISATTPEQ
ncbi:hypothetical protein [Chromobacterium sinusclupearum]|uniref:hypothetical protein n=1 Tax=Chromobacterium sinusclupearum TaxID=2077146 RepID=UPI0011AF7BFF|nr:hypothetical protein [Chromobacterium sinusclupearum]